MSDLDNEIQGKGFRGLPTLAYKVPNRQEKDEAPENTDAIPPVTQIVRPEKPAPLWLVRVRGYSILCAAGFFVSWAIHKINDSLRVPIQFPVGGIVAKSDHLAPSSSTSTSIPPVGTGLVLSTSQIRYCVYERHRVEGARMVANTHADASLRTFNAMSDEYNQRCGDSKYRQDELASIESEASLIQAKLEQEGKDRMAAANNPYTAAAALKSEGAQ